MTSDNAPRPPDARHRTPGRAASPDQGGDGAVSDPLTSLLHASHLMAPDDLAAQVTASARALGARETVLYLCDYEQVTLIPIPGAGVPERAALPIDGTPAGRAFRQVEVLGPEAAPGSYRLWLPLLDGVARLGVAEFVFSDEPGDELLDRLRPIASLVAELIVVNDAYSDVFARLRRRRSLSLAAEMQWELLPPLTFATDRLVITGGLEPAYDIGGDSFDYALNGNLADLLVIDSVGHGLPAALLASVAISAYRHARRNLHDLPELAGAVNAAIASQFRASQFATAVLARLDTGTGRLRWINAGHPEPLILRGSSVLQPPHCPPSRPLGLQDDGPVCCEARLEPGDRLLLYTDGITEARSPNGEFFGEQRLAEFIATAVVAGEAAPETVRRLLRQVLTHQADRLQDDASIVVLEWRTGDEQRLQL